MSLRLREPRAVLSALGVRQVPASDTGTRGLTAKPTPQQRPHR